MSVLKGLSQSLVYYFLFFLFFLFFSLIVMTVGRNTQHIIITRIIPILTSSQLPIRFLIYENQCLKSGQTYSNNSYKHIIDI
ncbi:hypothetical protein SPI02_03690 [Staphylococcus piscifermentans]|uniref:Uncharacterized protein n=1 Tax=Staphylococcus piscifermentans TaxID=70258 RepID=A0A512QK02_9STAP|nr:hypothetical protein SPI02_03690 [Staphylococcus piscifermentans]